MINNYSGPKGYEDVFFEYGGKSLGKILSKEKLKDIFHLQINDSIILKVKDILEGKYDSLQKLKNKGVVIKLSKGDDDYSVYSERGKNSSFTLPKIDKLSGEMDIRKILLELQNIEGVKSIILDEKIYVDNDYFHSVIYDGINMKIQVLDDKNLWFYELNNYGEITFFESNNTKFNYNELGKEFFNIMLEIHKKIYNRLGLQSINTEGFFMNKDYHLIQIKPTPLELFNENIGFKNGYMDDINHVLNTKFVYGLFSFTGIVEYISQENFKSIEEKIIILDEEVRYDNELIIYRLENNIPTILLDTYRGFHISHAKELLPKVGNIRNNFKYITFYGDENIKGKKVSLKSNGEQGQVLVYNYK